MDESKTVKILSNNIHFHMTNIVALNNLRPKVKIDFKHNGKVVSFKILNLGERQTINSESLRETLVALNSSIILNAFALFEASFEKLFIGNTRYKKSKWDSRTGNGKIYR